MGSVIGEVGTLFGGGANNSGFSASGTGIHNPVADYQYGQALENSSDALTQQKQLMQALNAQNGIGNQSQVFNQLQGVANGSGSNPAQAMLNQATGTNVANQAALMAGQRGASANPALMARQAAQQGAGIQQNAAGQAAVLQANQSLGALGQMGGMANQQAANQIGGVGSYNQFAQNQQKLIGDQLNAENNANVAMQSNMNNTNQSMAGVNAGNSAKAVGGAMNSIAGVDTSGGGGGGGAGGGGGGGGMEKVAGMIAGAKGGSVGENEITPPRGENPKLAQVPMSDRYPSHLRDIHSMYHGGEMDFRGGGPVPGEPKVQRDSLKNDVVDAKLSPKEIVLPLSVTQHENAPEEAARFVAALQKKSGGGGRRSEDDFKEALKRAISGRKAS